MKIPLWLIPLMLLFLSLTGLTSGSSVAGNKDSAPSLLIGLALSPTENPTSQPPQLSLDLDFILQCNDHALQIRIMPLHLLPKKSWNVYNLKNIEKVKRDEAAAKAKEEAEDERMQEIDGERRMQILRGEVPAPLPETEGKPDEDVRESRSYGTGRERKRRKKVGEDDTDFEMRIAAEHAQVVKREVDRQVVLRKSIYAPLVDRKGHIDLFPQELSGGPVEKNAEAEAEAAKKKREYEDQYTMRFSNAAGFKQALADPWYSKSGSTVQAVEEEAMGKDVWGNEDPKRKEREAARVVSSDPLAAMRQGAAKVRQVEKDRKRWMENKEREVKELEKDERRKRRKRKYEDDGEEDDLESLSLDKPERSSSHRSRHNDHSNERSHRHRHKIS